MWPAGHLSQTLTHLSATVRALSGPPGSAQDGLPFPVESAQYSLGGVGQQSLPPPASPPATPVVFPGGLFSFAYQANHQNVETADNQCSPASVANNFTWLNTTYGTPI